MTKKLYIDKQGYIAGISLKNTQVQESNNMALHVCKSEDHIIENRASLATSLGVELDIFVCANQTHSDHFYKVTQEDVGKGSQTLDSAIQDTDALYTYEPNVVLCSFG